MKALTPETARRLKPIEPAENDRLLLGLTKDSKYFKSHFYSVTKDSEGEDYIHWPSYRARHLVQRIPEKRRLNSGQVGEMWLFGATDMTAEIINCAWPAQNLVMEADAKLMMQVLLASKARQDLNAENVAHFREHNILPVHGYDIHPGMPLARYQELALCNSMYNEGYALFMEQGTGKTAIVIARICNEAKRHWEAKKKPYLAIVVCPKQLRYNWMLEFGKFATEKGRITRIGGSETRRIKQLIDAVSVDPDDKYSVIFISYDSLWRTQGLSRIPWNLGVLDESHFVKNAKTKRWKAVRDLRDTCESRMILTGTPITNTVLDLYTQWEFLGDGWSGFSSAATFREFYAVFDEQNRETGFSRLVGVQNLPFMKERIARQSFVVKKSEALPDLPDKVYDVYEVEMSKQQAEIYDKVRSSVMAEIEDELDKNQNKVMTVNNILTKLLRLAQVTSGFVVYDPIYSDDGEVIREKLIDRFDPNPKLEALVEILQEKTRNDKTIIWANFVQDIKSISSRLQLEKTDAVKFYGATSDTEREEAVRRFNEDPRCKVFIGNPAAGGTGLNLLGYPPGEHEDLYDTNCNHVIYYSQGWSMPHRAQSEDRAHRRGTRSNVRITDLTILGTIDEQIRARVMSKIEIADEVANVKELLKVIFNRPF